MRDRERSLPSQCQFSFTGHLVDRVIPWQSTLAEKKSAISFCRDLLERDLVGCFLRKAQRSSSQQNQQRCTKTHFQEIENGVLMNDRLTYALPFGAIGRLTEKVLVGNQVKKIFEYREKAIVDLFGAYK